MNYNIFNTLIFSGIVYGFVFAAIAIGNSGYRHRATPFLILTVLTLSLSNLQYWLMDVYNSNIPDMFYIQFELLIVPFFYLFLLRLLKASVPKSYLVFIPFFLATLYQFWANFIGVYKYHIYVEIFTIIYNIVLIGVSLRLLHSYRKKSVQKSEIKIRTKWIIQTIYLGVLLIVVWFFVTLTFRLGDKHTLNIYYPLWLGISILIYFLGQKALIDLKTLNEREMIRKWNVNQITSSTQIIKSGHVTFEKIENEIIVSKLYMNPNLSLSDVAKKFDISSGYLLEYKPTSYDWIISPQKPYQGSVEIVQDNFKNLDDILNIRGLTGKCEPVISAGWTCSFGNAHAPGECNASSFTYELNITSTCSGGGGNTSNNYNAIYVDDPLDGGLGGTGGSGSGAGSTGGGVGDQPPGFDDGGSITTPTGDILVIFSPDNPINDMNDYLECFNTGQSATVTVYVMEPNPGSGDTHDRSYVGHTFVSLQQGSNIATFGFYPISDEIKPLVSNSSPSIIGDDSGDTYTVSISTTVTGAILGEILNYAKNYQSTYNLNTYNCSDFGIEIGNKAGLNLPDAYGSWPLGGGSNPGTLGQYLLNRNSTSSQIINKNSGTAPQTNKGC